MSVNMECCPEFCESRQTDEMSESMPRNMSGKGLRAHTHTHRAEVARHNLAPAAVLSDGLLVRVEQVHIDDL